MCLRGIVALRNGTRREGGRGEESVFFSFFPSRSKIRGRREVGEEGNARSELNYRDKTNMFINGKDWMDRVRHTVVTLPRKIDRVSEA